MNTPSVAPTIQQAVALHQKGQLAEAEAAYRAILAADPRHFDATHLLGVALFQRGAAAVAEKQIGAALLINPRDAAAHNNLGNVLRAQKRAADALASYDKAIALKPAYAEAHGNRGTALRDLGRPEEALASFDAALALNPADASTWSHRGTLLLQMQRAGEALAAFDKVISIRPNADAYVYKGNILGGQGRIDEALKCFDAALALNPAYFGALLNRGNMLSALGRGAEAADSYKAALALQPGFADAYINLCRTLRGLRRDEEALGYIDKALALQPERLDFLSFRCDLLLSLGRPAEALATVEQEISLNPLSPAAHINRGNALKGLNRAQEAIASYNKAIALDPAVAEAHYNLGNAFIELKDFDQALRSFDRAGSLKADFADNYLSMSSALIHLKKYDEALEAISAAEKLRPGDVNFLINKGAILQGLKKVPEALEAFRQALAINPSLASVHYCMANLYSETQQLALTVESLKKTLSIDPAYEYAEGRLLHNKMMLCDWYGYEAAAAQLASRVRAGKNVVSPFEFLTLPSTAEEQRICSEICSRRLFPPLPPLWRGEKYKHDKIRLAYVSADFFTHATAHLMAGLFELHDRKRFHLTAISFSPNDGSPLRARLCEAFDEFIEVGHMGDDQIAQLIRERETDIAVDLKGFTTNARVNIFARRPAPVQVNYIGYPGTMGTPYIDYIIADRTVIPEEHRAFYTEKVIYMPDCYQPNDRKRAIAPTTPPRTAHGLPEGAFVFCSFNNNYKITPEVFDIWMRLLKAVPASVLWQLEINPGAAQNLRREAEKRGVAPERLVFAPRMDLPDHLARHRHGDLFIDTLPCTAHTTASDALWAGLPVLTCLGASFAGRVAASLLQAAGLSELVTNSLSEYEALAFKLAREPDTLAALKSKIVKNRDTCSLFDTEKYTRELEKSYERMMPA